MNRITINQGFVVGWLLTMFIFLSLAFAKAIYLEMEIHNLDRYIAGTSRAQADQETAKIRNCIMAKAKKNHVVRLEECLP